MPNFKPWVWREVRLFELRILDMVARHYSIQKWPSSKPRVGSREDVTSSNQDITTNVATFVCRRGVWGSCFILHRVFLSTLALKKIMPSSCCVVQGCSNPSNPKAGISLTGQTSIPQAVLSFARNTSRRIVSLERFMSEVRWNASSHFRFRQYGGRRIKSRLLQAVTVEWWVFTICYFAGIDLCILSKHFIFRHDLSVLCKTYYWLRKLSFIISLIYDFSVLQNQSMTLWNPVCRM